MLRELLKNITAKNKKVSGKLYSCFSDFSNSLVNSGNKQDPCYIKVLEEY